MSRAGQFPPNTNKIKRFIMFGFKKKIIDKQTEINDNKINRDVACRASLANIPTALSEDTSYIALMLVNTMQSGEALSQMAIGESFETQIACPNGYFYKVTKNQDSFNVTTTGKQ